VSIVDDINLEVAQRIAREARQKFAAAASLINDGRNMIKALNASGYRQSQMNEIMIQIDESSNSTHRAISAVDRLIG